MNAHPLELRQRIFNYHLSHSVRNTAELFGVSPDTVQRLKQRFIETGDLAPRSCHAEHAHAVSPEGELYLQALLVEQPDLSLAELHKEYARAYGVAVGTTTLHHLLQRLGYSRKKNILRPQKRQRCEPGQKRQLYQPDKGHPTGRLPVFGRNGRLPGRHLGLRPIPLRPAR